MKSMFLRGFAALVPAAAATLTHARSWPLQLVRIVECFPPGGTTDQIARHVQQPLLQLLGTQVIVGNRSGASGSIGANVTAKSAPGGYAFLLVPSIQGARAIAFTSKTCFPQLPDVSTIVEPGLVLRTFLPEEFGSFVADEAGRWVKVVRDNRISAGQ